MLGTTIFQNGSSFENDPNPGINNSKNENCLEDITSENYAELQAIFIKVTPDNPVSDTLFMEKYQILLLENFLQCQKPLAEIFQNSIVICEAKPRKLSQLDENNSSRSEVFSNDGGTPLQEQFDEIYALNSCSSRTQSLVKQLNAKYHLVPLSGTIGRQILALCNKIDVNGKFKNRSTICLCHGNNPKTVLLLGSFNKNQSRLIFQNQGLVSKQEQLPRLSSVKEAHLSGFEPSFTNIDASVYAQYDFLQCEDIKSSALNPVKDSQIRIECWWSDVHALLEPLAAACTCVARIKAVSGNHNTGAFSLYKEIQFIETLHKGLNTGLMTWSISNQSSSVMKRIKEFINEQKTIFHKKDKSAPINFNLAHLDDVVLKNRINLDFTEKLWTILKDSSSNKELQEALTFVYRALGEFFRPPYVFQKNTSTISRDIKGMMEKPISCPVMTPKLTMQMLLEIGVEKMRRDYVTLFLGLNLPLESMSYFLEPNLLSPDAITCLKKLHSVLELIIVCVKQLSLSSDLLSEFSRSIFKHYSSVPEIDLSHMFSFQIPAVKARQLLNPMRPTVWEVSFISRVNDFMKQSIHRYVTTPTHEHIYAPDNYHPKLMLKTASYVYSTATLVQSDEFRETE
ncbi:hypothetical protein JTE90_023091 [Oedothorax gibbosus]|uniref:Protein zwilch n=1 Tax=Oedothorax gibbosus TaxID=931172 RepID=A0AAV6UY43_9ARAC|nr:hypothetical protein JTE90_023091 [Oedothorax gibbosus]